MIEYVTASEAAKLLQLTRQGIANWIRSGMFPGIQRMSNAYNIIPIEDVWRLQETRLKQLEELQADTSAKIDKIRESISQRTSR